MQGVNMKRKTIVLSCLFVLVVAAFFSGCAGMYKASESNFKEPTVALSHVAHKMLHVVFSVLKNKKPYTPQLN